MTPAAAPPYPLMSVHDAAVDGLLCGSGGWLIIPKGGDVRVDWLTRKGCYRVTVDVMPGHVVDLPTCLEWLPELAARNEAVPALAALGGA